MERTPLPEPVTPCPAPEAVGFCVGPVLRIIWLLGEAIQGVISLLWLGWPRVAEQTDLQLQDRLLLSPRGLEKPCRPSHCRDHACREGSVSEAEAAPGSNIADTIPAPPQERTGVLPQTSLQPPYLPAQPLLHCSLPFFSSCCFLALFLFPLHTNFVSPPTPYPGPLHVPFPPPGNVCPQIFAQFPPSHRSGFNTATPAPSLSSLLFCLFFIALAVIEMMYLFIDLFVSLCSDKTFPMAVRLSCLLGIQHLGPWCREGSQ